MKAIALIPARLASTRLPQKLLIDLDGKTVIQRTYENTLASGLFKAVIVVTDSDDIQKSVEAIGGKVVRSSGEFESGTDRIAAAAKDLQADVFVNVQGDEPFVAKEPLQNLIDLFQDRSVQVASIRKPISDPALLQSPNIVKVVCDLNDNALLFSRATIPFLREGGVATSYFQHIGIYAFQKEALQSFPTLPQSPLELSEKIECLRFLENAIGIKMCTVSEMGIGIDVAEDVQRAKDFIANNNNN